MPTFDTPEPILATIETPAGHIWINASDRTDTTVDVQPSDETEDTDVRAAAQTRIEYANGALTVRAPKKKDRPLFGRVGSLEVTIDLPTNSRVDAKVWAGISSNGRLGESRLDTLNGHVRLDRVGGAKLHTAAGDVSVAASVGAVDITTAAGKIWIGEVQGTAVAKTSAGEITVGEVSDDLRLNTSYGDITVERAMATVSAKTAYGAVRVGEAVRGSLVLETGWGDVEVGIGAGTAAWLDVQSKLGKVRNSLDAADGPERSDETVEVRARTSSGDIVIRRS